MEFSPVDNEISAPLGFGGQELCSLLLRLAPEVLITKNNCLYSNINLVVAALDRNFVLIPNDTRTPTAFARGAGAAPRLGHRPTQTTVEETDAEPVDARVVEAEEIHDERSQRGSREGHPRRQLKRSRRHGE